LGVENQLEMAGIKKMGLFGKKKEKKADEAVKQEEVKPEAPPSPEFGPDGKPIKPDYLRASKVQLDDVETAIDIKARAESRASVLKRFEEKYGEKIDAPEFSAGLQYEYQLYEEGTYKTKRDLTEIEKAAKTGTEPGKTEGATPTEGATAAEAPKVEGETKTEGAKPKVVEPVVPKGPGMFNPEKAIDWPKSAFWCLVVGKPFWPIMRYVRYRSWKEEGWMKFLFIVDFVTIVEPLSWLWRLPARLIYEGIKFKKRYDAKKAEEARKAKEARKAAKAKEKAQKAYRA
jgi:hypothetical protein